MEYAAGFWTGASAKGYKGPSCNYPQQWTSQELWRQEDQQGCDEPSVALPMLPTPIPDQQGVMWEHSGYRVWIPTGSPDISKEGQLSQMMQEFLQYHDLVAIGEVLKSRHITTIHGLQMMRPTEKLEAHCAAKMMYNLLGRHYLNGTRTNILEAMFHVPVTSTARDHERETVLKQSLWSPEFMEAGKKYFGVERMTEYRRLMDQSDSMARLSAIHAGQACSIVNITKDLQPDRRSKEMIDFQALRAIVNQLAAWHVTGYVLGVDNKKAAERILHDVFDRNDEYGPDDGSPYQMVLAHFGRIQAEVTRSALSAESQNEDVCRGPKVLATGVSRQLSEIKALIEQVKQQNEQLQAEVKEMNKPKREEVQAEAPPE